MGKRQTALQKVRKKSLKGSETVFLAALTSLGNRGIEPPYPPSLITEEIIREDISSPGLPDGWWEVGMVRGQRGGRMMWWIVSTARRLAKKGKVTIMRGKKGDLLYFPEFGRYAGISKTRVGLSPSTALEVGKAKRMVEWRVKQEEASQEYKSGIGTVLDNLVVYEVKRAVCSVEFLEDELLELVGGDEELAEALKEIAVSEREKDEEER